MTRREKNGASSKSGRDERTKNPNDITVQRFLFLLRTFLDSILVKTAGTHSEILNDVLYVTIS